MVLISWPVRGSTTEILLETRLLIDQRLLLVEPQEFIIDGNQVREPVGMSGRRLEIRTHIVTGAQSAAENVLKCVRRCGLEVDQIMLNPLAYV